MKAHYTAEIELDGIWQRRVSVRDGYVRITLDEDTQIVGDLEDVRETLHEILVEMGQQQVGVVA